MRERNTYRYPIGIHDLLERESIGKHLVASDKIAVDNHDARE
jgi:hypothetical protein